MATDINTILELVRGRVAGLNLVFETVAIPVVRRKGVKAEEGVDPTPQITVSKADEPETLTYFTNTHDLLDTRVDITLVAPGNADALTHLDTWSAMRKTIIEAFTRKPDDHFGLPNLWRVKAMPKEFLDAATRKANYDAHAVRVQIQTWEVR